MCRRLSSLDHLSAGRIAWNIVSSYSKSEWDAYGHSMTDRSGRYERLEEYMGVCYQLWDSWEPGAIIADKASGIYAFRRYAAARHSNVLPGRYRRHRANGAGKITLLRTILGAVTHRSGAIHFQGRDIASLPVHARLARGIVLVPEGRQIIISLRLSGITRAAAPRRRLGGPWQDRRASTILWLASCMDPILRQGTRILYGARPRAVSLAGRPLPANPHERYPLVYAKVTLGRCIANSGTKADIVEDVRSRPSCLFTPLGGR
jgi:hypothetical protein